MPLPIPRIAWPITVDSGTRIAFQMETTSPNVESGYVAVLTAADYATPEALASHVATQMAAATGGNGSSFTTNGGTVSVAVSAAGLVSVTVGGIQSAGYDPVLFWNTPDTYDISGNVAIAQGALRVTSAGRIYLCTTAGNTANPYVSEPTGETSSVSDGTVTWSYQGTKTQAQLGAALLGFDTSNDTLTVSGGSGTATADSLLANVWTPDVPVRSDSEDRLLDSVVTVAATAGGQNKTTRWTPSGINGRTVRRRVRFGFVQPAKTFVADETGGASSFERFWRGDGVGQFTYSPDRTSPATDANVYFLTEDSARTFAPTRVSDTVERFDFEVEMQDYQS